MTALGNNGPSSEILAPRSCLQKGLVVTATGAYTNGGFAPNVYSRYGDVVELYVYDAEGAELALIGQERLPSIGGYGSWTVTATLNPTASGIPVHCVVAAQPTHAEVLAPSPNQIPTTTAPSQVASQVLVTPCGSGAGIKPSSIVLACADGNAQVVDLTWPSWGSSEATASGDYAVNDCVPTCVGGKFQEYPATITLADVKTIQGRQYFTTLTVHFTANSPFNTPSREFPLITP